jgi:glycolate oxidase FAD binding subunit
VATETRPTTGGSFADDIAAIASIADSPHDYEIDGVAPTVVAVPDDVDGVARVLGVAGSAGKAVSPRGGGTQTALGNRPERLDLVVDTSRLDRITHNPGDLTATVQAGVTLSELRARLAERGQFLAIDAPLPDRATVGGTLATGISGPARWQYGSPRDTVIGMTVVQPDGRITHAGGRVVKNVSGYDMARLHVGGLGTLGVIAEASFKLTPLPARQATVLATFDSARRSLEAALAVFSSGVVPLAITVFDASTAERMGQTLPQADSYLAIKLGGRPLTLDRLVRECRGECGRHAPGSVGVLDETVADGLWRGLTDFGYDDATRPLAGVRAHVQPSRVAALADALARLSDERIGPPSLVANPAYGTVLARWYAADRQAEHDGLVDILAGSRTAAHALDGRAVIERCPADVKARFDVWDDVGDTIEVMRGLKEQYDPGRTLNPGRFVGGI